MADEVLLRDQNRVVVLGGITDDSNQYITMLRVDPTTKRLMVSASGAGLGTVTSVSVVTANGVSGSVATATTTPAITLTLGAITPTTVNGLTITANGTNTLNITAGKTLAVTNSITLSGTDGTVMTFPSTSKTMLANDLSNVGTAVANLIFTDNTYDIGASGATRPRTGYFGTSIVSPVVNATTGVQINGAAASNKILKGNGTNFVASTETYAAPGTSGNVMTSDGTNWTSAAPASSGFTQLARVVLGSSNAVIASGTFTAKKYLEVYITCVGRSANGIIGLQFNGDTSSTYFFGYTQDGGALNQGNSVDKAQLCAQVSGDWFFKLSFNNVNSGRMIYTGTGFNWAANLAQAMTTFCGGNNSTSQITSISVVTSSGTYDTGSEIAIFGSD